MRRWLLWVQTARSQGPWTEQGTPAASQKMPVCVTGVRQTLSRNLGALISESGTCRRCPQSPTCPKHVLLRAWMWALEYFLRVGREIPGLESSSRFPGSHSPRVWELCSEQKVAPSSRARLETGQGCLPAPSQPLGPSAAPSLYPSGFSTENILPL